MNNRWRKKERKKITKELWITDEERKKRKREKKERK